MVTWVRFRSNGYLAYVTPDLAKALLAAGLAEYAYPDAQRRNPASG